MNTTTAILLVLVLTGCGPTSSSGGRAAEPAEPHRLPSSAPSDVVGGTPGTRGVAGMVKLTGLPPHRGLILNMALFRVDTAQAPAPYGGDPPADSITDVVAILEDVDLSRPESTSGERVVPFEFRRPAGLYYLQVRAVVFRPSGDGMVAQAEQFFFGSRPLTLEAGDVQGLELPVAWPDIPVEQLGSYGTVRPKR